MTKKREREILLKGTTQCKPTKASRRVAINDHSIVYLLRSLTLELQEHQHDCTPNDLLAAYAALALRPLATPCFR